MSDFDQFEQRFAIALRSDADANIPRFDSSAIARAAVARELRRPLSRRLREFFAPRQLKLSVSPVLVILGLLLALIAGLIAAGALRSERQNPVTLGPTGLPPSQPVPSINPSTSPTNLAPRPASWTATGSMVGDGGPAALLADGRVLVAGGWSQDTPNCYCLSQLYDPVTGSWTETGNMLIRPGLETATALSDGRVLATGGDGDVGNAAQLYDPATGTWAATGSMANPRAFFSATLLADGRVLVAGGFHQRETGPRRILASAELYDPRSGAWSVTGSMGVARYGHTATLLDDGRVLITGGGADRSGDGGVALASAELYDPITGSWSTTESLGVKRQGHTATRLPDGTVLVIGGSSIPGSYLTTTSLYDPRAGSWSGAASMSLARRMFTAVLLASGRVLVFGGWLDQGNKPNWDIPARAELYDPASGTWTPTAHVVTPRTGATAIALHDGRVLVYCGCGELTAELYDPGTGG